MSGDALLEWLADVGADQLAFALGDAARGAARKVGDRAIVAAERIGKVPRLDKLGARRAAIERCEVALDEDALVVIGTRAIAAHTDAIVRRQLAVRLPRTRGLLVLFELAAWCREDVAASPTWEALEAK